MIGAGDIKKGMVIDLDGKLCQVIDFQHVKMKHHALIKIKLKDIRLGHITEQSFPNTEKLARARMEYRPMQYLYSDGELYHFMDQENFEQSALDKEKLGDAINYLVDNMPVEIFSYNGEVLGVKLPDTVALVVSETGPSYKGDTAASASKPARLETGMTIQVPYFLSTGDKIRVDTRSGLYIERV